MHACEQAEGGDLVPHDGIGPRDGRSGGVGRKLVPASPHFPTPVMHALTHVHSAQATNPMRKRPCVRIGRRRKRQSERGRQRERAPESRGLRACLKRGGSQRGKAGRTLTKTHELTTRGKDTRTEGKTHELTKRGKDSQPKLGAMDVCASDKTSHTHATAGGRGQRVSARHDALPFQALLCRASPACRRAMTSPCTSERQRRGGHDRGRT